MNDNQKEKIQKMRIEGKSYLQIASILNINENTVKAFCSHDCYINNRFKKKGRLNESGAI